MKKILLFLFIVSYTTISFSQLIIGVSDSNQSALAITSNELSGSMASLFSCPLDQLDQEIKMQTLPQARLLQELKKQSFDLVMPLSKTPQRDQYGNFANTILEVGFTIFTKKKIKNINDLSGLTFAMLRTSSNNNFIVDRGGKVLEINGYNQALNMINKDRVDGTIIPNPVIDSFSHLTKGLEQTYLPTQKVGIYVNKDNYKLLEKLNTAIEHCLSKSLN